MQLTSILICHCHLKNVEYCPEIRSCFFKGGVVNSSRNLKLLLWHLRIPYTNLFKLSDFLRIIKNCSILTFCASKDRHIVWVYLHLRSTYICQGITAFVMCIDKRQYDALHVSSTPSSYTCQTITQFQYTFSLSTKHDAFTRSHP
jgi:hypothetical protein